MYPILGRYGPFFLYSYTVVLGVGIAAGLFLTSRLMRRNPEIHWSDRVLLTLVLGVIGGRAGFVWANWGYFQERPFELWQLWQGGLSYQGALVAGFCGLAIGHWLHPNTIRPSFASYAGLLAPGFVLSHAFGWLACWLEGCAYGQEAALGWLTADLPDEFGVFAVRYQTQLVGLVWSLLVLAAVLRLKQPETRFYVTMMGVSFGRFFITLLRGDTVPVLGFYRLDSILEAILTLLFFCLFVWHMAAQHQKK